MSTGMKKSQSPSQSKKKAKQPPEWLLEEYKSMVDLAREAEAQSPSPQFDTYWHTSRDRIAKALRDEYGMEV